nr:immunoglobulin light chain junction region [Macaca mulatta]
CMQSVEYPYSF